jgi:hypothetical protein
MKSRACLVEDQCSRSRKDLLFWVQMDVVMISSWPGRQGILIMISERHVTPLPTIIHTGVVHSGLGGVWLQDER